MTDFTKFAARLEIDYPEKLDTLSTLFRLLWIIPIAIILVLVTDAGQTVTNTVSLNESGEVVRKTRDAAGGLASGMAAATGLMIVFLQQYPRWWFDFARELKIELIAVGTDLYGATPVAIEVAAEILRSLGANDAALVKASRAAQLERVVTVALGG